MSERKVVLVTGSSRGIGAAAAVLAAKRGYDVAVNYNRDAAAAENVVAACLAAGAHAEAIRGDMARPEDVEAVFSATLTRFGRLDALVNNAGTTGVASRLDDATPETIEHVIDLNVTGAILAARAAVKAMSTRHGGAGGTIVNLSSRATGIGSPGEFVWYAASKGAIDALTLGLAREVAAEGIRVNAVAPGLIATDIHAAGGLSDRLQRLGPQIPMKRPGSSEEVAETILFLMSDAASYVTGAVLSVSGGR
jgi:NAD(P)-dependent dehydrogenase (short-subunit alcohol dehydrogenase family)